MRSFWHAKLIISLSSWEKETQANTRSSSVCITPTAAFSQVILQVINKTVTPNPWNTLMDCLWVFKNLKVISSINSSKSSYLPEYRSWNKARNRYVYFVWPSVNHSRSSGKRLIGRKKDVVKSVREVFARDSLIQATCLKQIPVIRIWYNDISIYSCPFSNETRLLLKGLNKVMAF